MKYIPLNCTYYHGLITAVSGPQLLFSDSVKLIDDGNINSVSFHWNNEAELWLGTYLLLNLNLLLQSPLVNSNLR